MTTKDAIKHLSDKIDYAEQCDDKWVDSVSIKALYVAVRAMAEERQKGKWIHNGSQWKNRFLCSNCNYLWWFPAEEAHYCPNCGSQNEKENENEKA